MYACNTSMGMMEAEAPVIKGHSYLCRVIEASLGNPKPCLKCIKATKGLFTYSKAFLCSFTSFKYKRIGKSSRVKLAKE